MTEMKTLQFGDSGEIFEIVDEKARNKSENLIKVTDGAVGADTDLVVSNNDSEIEIVTPDDITDLSFRVEKLDSAAEGNLYKIREDSTEAYRKDIPDDAMKWATLDKIGGKTIVQDGTLVSADVESVDVVGKNRIGYEMLQPYMDDWAIDGDVLTFTSSPGFYSKGIPVDMDECTISYDILNITGTNFRFRVVFEDGVIQETIGNGTGSKWVHISRTFNNVNGRIVEIRGNWSMAGSFQIRHLMIGTEPSDYLPHYHTSHQIPEAIRDLPGYGWSAGSVFNEVDYEHKQYIQRVGSVDLGSLTWIYIAAYLGLMTCKIGSPTGSSNSYSNILCSKFPTIKQYDGNTQQGIFVHNGVLGLSVNGSGITDPAEFKSSVQGVMLYYELIDPIITDISDLIPDGFTDIEVEAGGSITFEQSELALPVPNKETYMIKEDKVGFEDYATSSKSGVLKISGNAFGIENGILYVQSQTLSQYNATGVHSAVSKGTLDNIWDARHIVLTQAEYDALATKDPKALYLIREEG